MYTKHLPQTKPLSRLWLLIGVLSLAVAGLYAIVLVGARSPSAGAAAVLADIFHTSLVAHVDLSVLVWFLAISCMVWSTEAARGVGRIRVPMLEEASLTSFGLGAAGIAVSPFAGAPALMSNYIPVITAPVFFFGLMLAGCGVALQLVRYFLAGNFDSVGAFTAAVITLIALFCFGWATALMPHVLSGQEYYDLLFWGGGHVLILAFGQMAMVAWVMLAHALQPGLKVGKFLYFCFGISVAAALIAVALFLHYDVTSFEFRQHFTREVMMLGGIGPGLAALWSLRHISMPSSRERALFTAQAMSLLLFLYGGVLGLLISGQNVTIPAHYHGQIVGITLAFMGLTYFWLPKLGYADVAGTKLARWQPIVLGIGQALHITGLAWSGGYGVLRKTPGGLEHASAAVKAAMGLMGLGGTLAIIGGLMFVVVVFLSVKNSPK